MSRTSESLRTHVHSLIRAGETNKSIAERLKMARSTVAAIRATAPFSAENQTGSANIPPGNYGADQPPPADSPREFRAGYHDRTFRSFAAPLLFEGWSLERVRNAVVLHDQGFFLESSMLAIVVSRFGPVFAALSQAIAPALALPRHVRGGQRGLGRMLRDEVEAQLAPRGGLLPSPYFPPTLWGSTALDLRLMGFAIFQHVYGDPDPDTMVRPVYTRRWPTWATQYYRYRRTFVALTTEGPIDIINGDGKFTLIADTEEPHFDGAIRALGIEAIDGALAKEARANYIDRYGNPKWVGIMPEKTAVRSPEGDAMFDAMETIQGPDGWGVIPHGADFKTAQMTAGQNAVFDSALDNVWKFVAAILLGSDGTMSPSTGVYSAPIFAGVRRDLIDRMLQAMVRAINMGHVDPWLDLNYRRSILEDRTGWIEPVLDIPLPDPDADARIKSLAERVSSLHKIVQEERAAGFVVTQDRVAALAAQLEVDEPMLAQMTAPTTIALAPTDVAKIVRVDEARASQGLPPIGDERGMLTIVEMEQQAVAKAAAEQAAAEAAAQNEKSATNEPTTQETATP